MELNLREIRKKKGLTQNQLALAVGATKRQIGAWERGENDLPMDFALSIADVLGCTVDDIARRTEYGFVTMYSEDEIKLIEMYRMLDFNAKRAILVGLDAYTDGFM